MNTNTTQIIERDEAFRYFERQMRHRPTNPTPREQVVYEHYSLVIAIASEYQHQGLEIMDLIMAGMTGLIMAHDRYDAAQGKEFSTYATYWIRGEITDELTLNGHPIRQHWRSRRDIMRIHREQERFLLAEGREPTVDELSEMVGICSTRVAMLLSCSEPFLPFEEECNE